MSAIVNRNLCVLDEEEDDKWVLVFLLWDEYALVGIKDFYSDG